MESWNRILHTALLGTDKRTLRKEEAAPELAGYVDTIASITADKEDQFLQIAALHYNYRQCGAMPAHAATASITLAAAEEKIYASVAAHGALSAVFETGSTSLLNYWLELCTRNNLIVQPELIVPLLEAVARQKPLQELALDCCGKRGAWLAGMNPDWAYGAPPEEDLWQTGTLEQRKKFLARLRTEDPAKGRALLQAAWPQENAAARAELVQQLAINHGTDDLPWLEELLNDKSTKVKEAVTELLKKMPSSSIVHAYRRLLQNSVHLKKERALLGLVSKTIIELGPVGPLDESIYKTGITQMSDEKNESVRNSFLIYQLISLVPPSVLEEHLQLSKQELLKLMDNTSMKEYPSNPLYLAAVRFHDVEWLRIFLAAKDDDDSYPAVLELLPQKEVEATAISLLSNKSLAAQTLRQVAGFGQEWGLALAKAVLAFTSQDTYSYPRNFYTGIAHLLPPSIIHELDKFEPATEYMKNNWKGIRETIIRLIEVKQQTRNAFNE